MYTVLQTCTEASLIGQWYVQISEIHCTLHTSITQWRGFSSYNQVQTNRM